MLLLLVAWGLRRRLDGAWLATLLILAAGIVLSLLRGWHVEQAAVLALTLLALAPCRRAFYRRAALFSERFSPGWLLALAAVLLARALARVFLPSPRPVQRRSVVALRARRGCAPLAPGDGGRADPASDRRRRPAAAGRPRPPAPVPQPGDVARARAVIAATPDAPVAANLALLGDKRFLFSESGRSFIMFGAHGGSWIALGEPVGPADERQEMLWRFRELCDRDGARPAFYQVTPESMPQFLELGLTFQKLGEEALVPLDRFAIDGPDHRGLRHTLGGCAATAAGSRSSPLEQVPAILDTLAAISDEWLRSKNVREKGFSLGRFDPDYMRNFPVAVVRVGERIVAFRQSLGRAAIVTSCRST